LAIREHSLGPKHPEVAATLNNLAVLLDFTGRYGEAEPLARRALSIRERVLGPEHPDVATSLNDLAELLHQMDRYDDAEPLYRRALSVRERALGPEHPDVATSLNALAVFLKDTGRYGEAEPLARRALAIRERALGPEHPNVAISLNDLAVILTNTGRYGEAESLYRRALAIDEHALGPDHHAVAGILGNLARLLKVTGRYGEAEPLYRRALAIDEHALGPEHPVVSLDLNYLGDFLRETGRYGEAEPLYRRALAIREQTLGRDHHAVAASLNNLAGLLADTGHYGEAELLFRRALVIREHAHGPGHPAVAISLDNLAELLRVMRRYGEAEPLYRRALTVREHALGPEHPDVATSLNNLALLLHDTGHDGEAEPLLRRALRVCEASTVPRVCAAIESSMMRFYRDARPAQPALATFYGKLAVNDLQSLRGSLQGSEAKTQELFLQSVQDTYRDLLALLVDAGHLAEAEQVRTMLKEQEFYDFIRREAAEDPRTTRASLSAFEAGRNQELKAAGESLYRLAEKIAPLDAKARRGETLSLEENAQRRSLRAVLDSADKRFNQTLEQISAAFRELGDSPQRLEEERRHLEETLAGLAPELGNGIAILQTVTLPDRLVLLLTIGEIRTAYSSPIAARDLNALIDRTACALRDSHLDPRPRLGELYDDIVRPLRSDLDAAHASVLMFSLDGALRYLPMSALYDSRKGRYLIEDYPVTLFDEAAHLSIKDPPSAHWRVAGMGVERAFPGFPELEAVPAELAAIVSDAKHPSGVLPGTAVLNEQFTEQFLTEAARDYPVLHIASHFDFHPGNDTESFLLLGDGTHFTLADFGRRLQLQRVEMLTLSACNTAVGTGGEGTEVEGLAVLAQQRGAKSVLATLWSVDDRSTGELMATFYRRREGNNLSKAHALREAQLSLLRGKADRLREPPDENRGFRFHTTAPNCDSLAWTPPAHAPYAHPYYWAPFVLVGNWK
jgi:CHAT domain-containing protein/tetratricopeptide (TPR) repeat protein